MTVVGFRQGRAYDRSRSNWDGTGPRPLGWAMWYPAANGIREEPVSADGWFSKAPVAVDAPVDRSRQRYPVVLLSHGTGGSTAGLDWLAHRLVRHGFVALAVNHHGNTGAEPYRAEGFLCLWERAKDLSVLLDSEDWKEALFHHLDDSRVFVGGFSAGAYAAMLLAGAIADFSQFDASNPRQSPHRGPREFPDLAEEIPRLLEDSQVFRQSWQRVSLPYRDERFKAALVCAPGRSVLCLNEKSLAQIRMPALIVAGDGDIIAPVAECSQWLHQRVPGSRLEILGGAGHYVFLPEGTPRGLSEAPQYFTDAPGVDRRAVHETVAELAVTLFQASA